MIPEFSPHESRFSVFSFRFPWRSRSSDDDGGDYCPHIAQRAIGLLTASYAFPAFSVSPNGKWVLYERRRLPVIAATNGGPHHLLAPATVDAEGWVDLFKLAVTSESAESLFRPQWHPRGDAVAFTPDLQRRFLHPVCIFGQPTTRPCGCSSRVQIPAARALPRVGHDLGVCRMVRRQGGDSHFDCQDPESGLPPNDPGVFLAYDIGTRTLERVGNPAHRAP